MIVSLRKHGNQVIWEFHLIKNQVSENQVHGYLYIVARFSVDQRATQPEHDSNDYQIQQQEINDESIAANNVQASSSLMYPHGNGSLTESVINSISQENHVVFEAQINRKLPTQTDPRRYISLLDEAGNEITIKIV